MQYLKDVANDRHCLGWLPPDAHALAGEVIPVPLAPVRERAIAFSLDSGVLGAHFIEGDYLRTHYFCDQCRLVEMVNNDFDVSTLGDRFTFVFIGPK